MSRPSDLVQGTLDLLLLKILALEPLHGWAIGQRLRQVSGNVLQVSDGSLYPALHKLENEGWVKAEWKPTENNRRAKFYALTKTGRRRLGDDERHRVVELALAAEKRRRGRRQKHSARRSQRGMSVGPEL